MWLIHVRPPSTLGCAFHHIRTFPAHVDPASGKSYGWLGATSPHLCTSHLTNDFHLSERMIISGIWVPMWLMLASRTARCMIFRGLFWTTGFHTRPTLRLPRFEGWMSQKARTVNSTVAIMHFRTRLPVAVTKMPEGRTVSSV